MKYKKFTLYPAIDIKNGKCVRLLFGDMERETIYHENPLDQAMWFVDQGAEWLHIVDLDGAAEGKNVNCLLYTSPSPRDATLSRMPSSA